MGAIARGGRTVAPLLPVDDELRILVLLGAPALAHLGFGRIVASEIEAPSMFVNMV